MIQNMQRVNNSVLLSAYVRALIDECTVSIEKYLILGLIIQSTGDKNMK